MSVLATSVVLQVIAATSHFAIDFSGNSTRNACVDLPEGPQTYRKKHSRSSKVRLVFRYRFPALISGETAMFLAFPLPLESCTGRFILWRQGGSTANIACVCVGTESIVANTCIRFTGDAFPFGLTWKRSDSILVRRHINETNRLRRRRSVA